MFCSIPDYRPLEFNKVTNATTGRSIWFVVSERKNSDGVYHDFTRIAIDDWTYTVDQLHQLIGIAHVQEESPELINYMVGKAKYPTLINFIFKDGKWGWQWEMPFIDKEGSITRWNGLTEYNYTKFQLEKIRQRAVSQEESADLLECLDNAISRAGETLVPYPQS